MQPNKDLKVSFCLKESREPTRNNVEYSQYREPDTENKQVNYNVISLSFYLPFSLLFLLAQPLFQTCKSS